MITVSHGEAQLRDRLGRARRADVMDTCGR